jgi:hypothetical protein
MVTIQAPLIRLPADLMRRAPSTEDSEMEGTRLALLALNFPADVG